MTPRELLERYSEEAGAHGYEGQSYLREECAAKAFAALRAVLDLHVPWAPPEGAQWVSGGAASHCDGCATGDPFLDPDWPCPTVKAITSALEAS